MKLIKIILQIAVLFAFSYLGSLLHQYLNIPLPGSIIGLLLLLAALSSKLFKPDWIQHGAGFLLAFLPLLFLPATIGVMNYASLFSGKGILICFAVVISTLATMIIAGKTSQLLENKTLKRKEQ